jgi:late competence protein required for DNA uptake (superfamily II DNA/RNA helicase)
LNDIVVHPGLSPLQSVMVRVIVWLVDVKKANVLIYMESPYDIWQNTAAVLKDMHQIKVVNLHSQKRRRLEEMNESREVIFFPAGHLEGMYLEFVTHVFVVGNVKNDAIFAEVLKRTLRLGRTIPLRIIETSPSSVH